MDDKNQQKPSQAQDLEASPSSYISQPHKLVIQPSAELVKEVAAEQAEKAATQSVQSPQPTEPQSVAPATAAQTSQPQTENAPQPTPTPDQTMRPVPPQPIYPEPTAGLGVAAPQPTLARQPETSAETQTSTTRNRKVLVVRAVAGVLILLEILSLYNQFVVLHSSFMNIYNVATVFVTFALLIGIVRLKELARVIYVYLSMLVLAISIFGLVQLYVQKQATPTPAVQTSSVARQEVMDKSTIAAANRNPNLTPAQKESEREVEDHLKSLESSTSSSSTVSKAKQYVAESLTVILAVGPLIFLTRPSIKGLFS